MQRITNPPGQGLQTPTATTAGGENRRDAQKRHRIEVSLWAFGMLLFIISCIVIHFHPRPYAFELATTHAVQGMQIAFWLLAVIQFPSVVNNPIPGTTILVVWVAGLLLIALIQRLRKSPAFTWCMAGVFLALTVMSSAGLNVLLDIAIGRPRPEPKIDHIQLHTPLVPFPTYPSGHTEHDIAFYGFLLYLSLTKPIRQWRYHWFLLPLQIYAVFDIFDIGLSRIYDGDHWLLDVLGGYLEGALYLFFFIFLYRWFTDWFAKRHQRKMMDHRAFAR